MSEEKDCPSNEGCLSELNNPDIVCEECHLSFTRNSNYYRHMRKIHQKEVLDISKGKVCGICNKILSSTPLLLDHIAEEHNVSLQFTEETFYCEDDFLKWKSAIEKEGQASFALTVRRDGAVDGVKKRWYTCHRSGVPKKLQQRSRKCSSMKVGFTCPAYINVVSDTVDGITCINVRYQSVHVGHELGVKIRLSNEDKTHLASSLNAGLSITSLLKELAENYPPSHPYRQITRKDLYNISKTFKISRTRLWQPEDLETVDIVVKKIFNSDFQSALLVYKPVGETLPEYPTINENDFLLGIMNDVQEKLLELYGRTCIMLDYTDYKVFYLSIVMVRDEKNQSVPVATLFSSEISSELIEPFFRAIQLRLPRLRTKVIMSDDVISFHSMWHKVFEDGAHHLLCSWFVLRNLIRSVEIKVKSENRKDFKVKLRAIMKEEDIAAFELMMNTFVEEYEDEEKDFMTYFRTNYECRAKKWAYCYRIALGINPEMKLERWRNQLKLDEKVSKRLDKTLSSVSSAIAKKLISNALVMSLDKLSARLLLCQKLHEESVSEGDQYDVVEADEKKCTISERGNGKNFRYTLEKLMDICDCHIRCKPCNVCIHSMSCTCVDYCIHFAVCKHMHRFCGPFAPVSKVVAATTTTTTDRESDDDSVGFVVDNEPFSPMETDDVRSAPEPVPDPQFIVDDVRARVKTQLEILEMRIEGISLLEVLRNVEVNVNAINSYLDDAIPSGTVSDKVPKT